MYRKISFIIAVLVTLQTGYSLICSDNSAKGVIHCSNGDICFLHVDNVTRHITKGCHSPTVCENIQDGSKCTTCDTDMCNSKTNTIYLSVVLPILISFIHVLKDI